MATESVKDFLVSSFYLVLTSFLWREGQKLPGEQFLHILAVPSRFTPFCSLNPHAYPCGIIARSAKTFRGYNMVLTCFFWRSSRTFCEHSRLSAVGACTANMPSVALSTKPLCSWCVSLELEVCQGWPHLINVHPFSGRSPWTQPLHGSCTVLRWFFQCFYMFRTWFLHGLAWFFLLLS